MATGLNKVLDHLRRIVTPPNGDLTDGQLLARFVASRDEASFAVLVRRHGPMVWRLCLRLLGHFQDAEDTFQATFMVLARKASSILKHESVGSFLYGVAYRTALKARAIHARRRSREKQVEEMPHPEIPPFEPHDWLDQELNLLPEHYRAVIVACDLEGLSRKEAAHQLELSEGTVSSRLARGRRLLAKRLSLTSGAVAAAFAEGVASAHIPASLLSSATKVAMGQALASNAVEILVKGVLKTMLLAKLKLTVGAVMVMVALGASGLVYRASGQPAPLATEQKPSGKPRSELEALRRENELLKLNLEVVLEKVRAQEAELRKLKAQASLTGTLAISPDGKSLAIQAAGSADFKEWTGELKVWDTVTGKELKKQAATQNSKKELQRTIDAMEKALKELREQLKKQEAAPPGK